jgi:hypothetical protein
MQAIRSQDILIICLPVIQGTGLRGKKNGNPVLRSRPARQEGCLGVASLAPWRAAEKTAPSNVAPCQPEG